MEVVVECLLINVQGSLGALIMLGFGIAALLMSCIWVPYVAYKERWWLGPLVLFVPFGFVVFSILHWQVAKKPVMWSVAMSFCCVSLFLLRHFASLYFSPYRFSS